MQTGCAEVVGGPTGSDGGRQGQTEAGNSWPVRFPGNSRPVRFTVTRSAEPVAQVAGFRFQVPELPPVFSHSLSWPMLMVRSVVLHMS